ncbi:MAG: hypothetical protein V4463_22910 [Pseudomonadota bacterium]
MTFQWETPASTWLEDEHSGQFSLAASSGLGPAPALARARLPDVAALLGASLPASCQCSSIYPEGFAFCPQCGAALDRRAGRHDDDADWFGPWADQGLPRHVPHGLPVTALALGESLEGRRAAARCERTMPVPPNARCVFAAAHFGFAVQRLLALSPGRGVLQYWEPVGEQWHVFLPADGAAPLRFEGADYAWLPVLHPRRGEVALVPATTGLLRLWIDPVNESYHTETALDMAPAASPGAVRRHVACLVEQGRRFWCAHADLSGAQLFDCAAPATGWSRPFSYDGQLVWLHTLGRLAWQPGGAPAFTPWPAGWSPRLDFGGPTQSRDGRLWLAGHDGGGYAFLELLAGAPERMPISGARLGFANLLFRRGHAVLGEPWDEANVEEQHQDDALVLPLLRSYNNHRTDASGLVLRFHGWTGRAEEALGERAIARTTIEWIGKTNVVLDEVARLARPQDCVPLVYDKTLWLHHPDWNRMRGWLLEEMP